MDEYPAVPRVSLRAVQADIHNGDLLLCAGESPMSRMIQAATESPFSHVGLLIRAAATGGLLVAESVESIGVRVVSLRRYLTNYDGAGHGYRGALYLARHRAVDLSQQAALATFVQRAIDLLGSDYDTRQIVRIIARIVADKLALPPQPRIDDTSFICSEFVAICLAAIGVDVPYHRANFITPADFATCSEVDFLWELAVDRGED